VLLKVLWVGRGLGAGKYVIGVEFYVHIPMSRFWWHNRIATCFVVSLYIHTQVPASFDMTSQLDGSLHMANDQTIVKKPPQVVLVTGAVKCGHFAYHCVMNSS
jgi:hypothetical protein